MRVVNNFFRYGLKVFGNSTEIKILILILLAGVMTIPFGISWGVEKEGSINPFPIGEKLVYDVSFLGIPAGTQVNTVREKTVLNGYEVYHIVQETKSNAFVSLFFRLHNVVECYIDAEKFYPRLLRKEFREGKVHKKLTIELDWEKGEARFRQEVPEFFETSVPLPEFALDTVSLSYYLRTLDLEVGKKINLNMILDQEIKPVIGEIKANEKLKFSWGTEDSYLIVEEKTRIKIWRMKEGEKIPLIIKQHTDYGDLVGVLRKLP